MGHPLRRSFEAGYVLVGATPLLLVLLWPSRPLDTLHPADTVDRAPRIVYVQRSASMNDPTVLALPPAYLEFGGLTAPGDEDVAVERMHLPIEPAYLERDAVAQRESHADRHASPALRDRARNALALDVPPPPAPAAETHARTATAPEPGLHIRALGPLSKAVENPTDWPREGPAAAQVWSATATLTIDADGRVQEAVLEQPVAPAVPIERLLPQLYRLRFAPAATERAGRIRILHVPPPPTAPPVAP